jgi:two-component system response regulator AtoC
MGQPKETRGRVLVFEAPALSPEYLAGLARRGFEIERAPAGSDPVERAEAGKFAVLVTEFAADAGPQLALAEAIAQRLPLLDLIILSRKPRLEVALAAMRAGAYDYLAWPQPLDALAIALDRAMQHRSLRREVRRLRKVLNPGGGFSEILGESPAMRSVFSIMERVAPARAPVLVTGETGTGKELVAKALHQAGQNPEGPFVVINCAALPEPLLESELFGHVKGAFTDARSTHRGLFLQANGGTLFLDEIGELPPSIQAKLLRALQTRTVRPVGGDQETPFDARLVTATNRDLDARISAGLFREDLYYRIHVIHIELPPLRSRGADILLLANHFLRQAAALSGDPLPTIAPEAARRLLEYPWPGNIRELENAMERGMALASGGPIRLEDLPTRIRDWRPQTALVPSNDPEELITLRALEARYIQRVLAAVAGNRTAAAKVLGIDRKSLYRKLVRLGMEADEPDEG